MFNQNNRHVRGMITLRVAITTTKYQQYHHFDSILEA